MRQDLPGGRVLHRQEGGRRCAVCEALEVEQFIALERHVGPHDEERLLPRCQQHQLQGLQAHHRIRERQHRHQPHLPARRLSLLLTI